MMTFHFSRTFFPKCLKKKKRIREHDGDRDEFEGKCGEETP